MLKESIVFCIQSAMNTFNVWFLNTCSSIWCFTDVLKYLLTFSSYTVVRKLQEFESPYISLKYASNVGTHRIVLRKRYRLQLITFIKMSIKLKYRYLQLTVTHWSSSSLMSNWTFLLAWKINLSTNHDNLCKVD